MEDLLISVIESLGYSCRLQGSYAPDEAYPDHFFTYWNDSADGNSFYDNEESVIVWQYSLNFYSVDPLLVNSLLLEAKKELKAKGWVIHGAGYSVMSDEPTHTGRGITVLYRQEQ